jgi:hypothetical protein
MRIVLGFRTLRLAPATRQSIDPLRCSIADACRNHLAFFLVVVCQADVVAIPRNKSTARTPT